MSCLLLQQLLLCNIDTINMAVKEMGIDITMNHVSLSRHRERLSFIDKCISYLLQLGEWLHYNISIQLTCCIYTCKYYIRILL